MSLQRIRVRDTQFIPMSAKEMVGKTISIAVADDHGDDKESAAVRVGATEEHTVLFGRKRSAIVCALNKRFDPSRSLFCKRKTSNRTVCSGMIVCVQFNYLFPI